MKCEYCDNPVPNGVMRCPSCGAAVMQAGSEAATVQANSMAAAQKPEPAQHANATSIDPYLYVDRKSRIAYIILAIVFGGIGVHNFYAGYIGRGIAQLLITVLSLGLLSWVSWLWAIIEICVVKHDGRSIPFE